MAPTYGHHNNFYDPVGSQANQPQGYTYQTSSTSASQPASASYGGSSYPGYGSHSYSSQHYGTNATTQQNATSSGVGGTHAATGVGLSGVSGQDNQASTNRSSNTLQYGSGIGSWGNPNYASSSYNGSLNSPGRSQSTTSPQYPSTAPSSTFGRLSYNAPPQQSQSSATAQHQSSYTPVDSADANRRMYDTSQHRVNTTEPSRYASPIHAVQAQQQQPPRHKSHGRQASRGSYQQPSPVMNARAPSQVDHRQQSTSVEPSPTVDPSQVYDFRAEREKKEKIEAEKRRKREEAEAAKRAEEARVAEEKRKVEEAERQAKERQAEEARREMEEVQRVAGEQAAAARVEAHRKQDEQRKARESTNAANTLAALATSSNVPDMDESSPPLNDEEAEMRAMFKKMREFNTKNPAMLAKLWEEERRSHASQSRPPQTTSTSQPAAVSQTTSVHQNGASSTPLSGSTTTPNQMKPFSNPPKGKAPAADPAAKHTPTAQANNDTANNQGPPANTNLWPPGKKGLLADIAARWLESVNPQRAVIPKEILDLLDLNPNYVQLCESLEANGLKFDRTDFARELLRGVHPAGNTNQPSHKVGDTAIMSANGTVAQASGAVTPVTGEPKAKRPRATKAEMEQRRAASLAKSLEKQAKGKANATSNDSMVQYEMPSFSTNAPSHHAGQVNHMASAEGSVASISVQSPHAMSPMPAHSSQQASRHLSQSVQPDQQRPTHQHAQQSGPSPVGSAQQTPEVKQPSPPRPPANKEEAARKRGFGELVDLTAGDSDEELPPRKMVQTPQGFDVQRPRPYQQQPPSFNNTVPSTPTVPSSDASAQTYRPPGVPTTAQMIMMPNGSFGPAPPTNNSAPRVPTPNMNKPPSNVQSSFAPPSQPSKRKGPTNEQLQADRVRGKMVVEPIMRDRVLRRSTYDTRTIARDVLLATGRHPDMRPLNGHLHVMQKLLGDRGGMVDQSGNKSDLATIKWDILDPVPTKKSEVAKKPGSGDVNAIGGTARTTEVDDNDADDENDVAQSSEVTQAVDGARQNSALDRTHLHNNAALSNNKPSAPKKRGRPPRSSLIKNQDNDGASTMSTEHRRDVGGNARSTPNASTRAASSSQPPAGAPLGYAAFRERDESGNIIKKKGRPVGWRKSIHSREAQGLTPAKSGSWGSKAKAPTVKQNERLQEPAYQIYKCQWLDCSAELHSLEVLKKHVIKVHGRPDTDGSFHCLWKGCKEANKQAASGRPQSQSAEFEDIADWLLHVDKDHLQPVAWTLGDGPRGGLSGKLVADSSQT